MCDLRC